MSPVRNRGRIVSKIINLMKYIINKKKGQRSVSVRALFRTGWMNQNQ